MGVIRGMLGASTMAGMGIGGPFTTSCAAGWHQQSSGA